MEAPLPYSSVEYWGKKQNVHDAEVVVLVLLLAPVLGWEEADTALPGLSM
jgi:hypothetical protein